MKDQLTEDLKIIRRVRAQYLKDARYVARSEQPVDSTDPLVLRTDSPAQVARMRLRLKLAEKISARLRALNLTPEHAAQLLRVTQQRISELKECSVQDISIDELVEMAARTGLRVRMTVNARG